MAATFVCPLDVIKTRLQVHGMPPGQRGILIQTLCSIIPLNILCCIYQWSEEMGDSGFAGLNLSIEKLVQVAIFNHTRFTS